MGVLKVDVNDGWPTPPPPTCGNCMHLDDLDDWTGCDGDPFGACPEGDPIMRVRRDFGPKEMPCGGELWARR